jgi:hypothetical protein
MSRTVIVILIYYRQKPIDLIYIDSVFTQTSPNENVGARRLLPQNMPVICSMRKTKLNSMREMSKY